MTSTELHSALSAFLQQYRYAPLPLECNAIGHFELQARINGEPVRLLLDTGASHTVLDPLAADRLNLTRGNSHERGGGVGSTDQEVQTTSILSMRVGEVELGERSLYVLDLGHVNQALARLGGAAIDGAVGGDILRPREAIIDYAGSTLYLRPPVAPGLA
jgi:hypothetical protein